MCLLLDTLIVLATVAVMEAVAWTSHKYVMHGWGWHRSHHEPHRGWFEKNAMHWCSPASPSC